MKKIFILVIVNDIGIVVIKTSFLALFQKVVSIILLFIMSIELYLGDFFTLFL